jgi:hypothetical protein
MPTLISGMTNLGDLAGDRPVAALLDVPLQTRLPVAW